MLLACSLRNVLRTTTPCALSTSELPKLLRSQGFLTFWLWKCATTPCAFSTSELANALRTRGVDFQTCFAPNRRRALFDLSSPQMALYLPVWGAYFSTLPATKDWTNTVFRDFSTFSHTRIIFLLCFLISSLCLSLL